eukprot:3323951-Rhodomonas_salina.3
MPPSFAECLRSRRKGAANKRRGIGRGQRERRGGREVWRGREGDGRGRTEEGNKLEPAPHEVDAEEHKASGGGLEAVEHRGVLQDEVDLDV